jgi:hypothetical protein
LSPQKPVCALKTFFAHKPSCARRLFFAQNLITALNLFFVAVLMMMMMMPAAWAVDVDNDARAKVESAKAMKLYTAKKYKEAQKQFEIAAQYGSRDPGIQYYLGASALQNQDYETFKRAMARVLVAKHFKQGFGAHAKLALLQKAPGCDPYPCVTGAGSLSRFVRSSMPIKVYISNGLMLPHPYRGREGLRPDEILALLKLVKQGPAFYQSLECDPSFQSQYASSVASGLQAWNWAQQEGILTYQLVNSPTEAQIVVTWCPKLERLHTAFTQYMTSNMFGNKIIMQVATNDPKKLDGQFLPWIAAHEFGHCWGMSYHSTNPKDLMSAEANLTKPHGSFSDNDKLTLRALYDLAPSLKR